MTYLNKNIVFEISKQKRNCTGKVIKKTQNYNTTRNLSI